MASCVFLLLCNQGVEFEVSLVSVKSVCSVFGCVVLLLGNQGVEFEVTGQSVVSVRNLCAQSSAVLSCF